MISPWNFTNVHVKHGPLNLGFSPQLLRASKSGRFHGNPPILCCIDWILIESILMNYYINLQSNKIFLHGDYKHI